jgi:hypothetical protein
MRERGVSEADVLATVETGERFAAPWDRTGFRKRFRGTIGRARREVVAYAERQDELWLVVTVLVSPARTRSAT